MNTTRRPLVAAVVALGGVITLAGTTGVFAVFTDRATTGTNTYATKDLPRAAELKIATGDLATAGTWTVTCGSYVDDLETGMITLTDVTPGGGFNSDFVCVKNAGSQTVDVTASAIDVTDLDTDCTGDEGVVDTTCGPDETTQADQAGELSPLVHISMVTAPCSDANQGGQGVGTVATMSNASVGSLAPGEVTCVRFDSGYDPTEAQAQTAQSDTATWRFAFDGAVPTT